MLNTYKSKFTGIEIDDLLGEIDSKIGTTELAESVEEVIKRLQGTSANQDGYKDPIFTKEFVGSTTLDDMNTWLDNQFFAIKDGVYYRNGQSGSYAISKDVPQCLINISFQGVKIYVYNAPRSFAEGRFEQFAIGATARGNGITWGSHIMRRESTYDFTTKRVTWTAWEKINSDVDKSYVDTQLAKKVDKVSGKGLSTNDYTTAEKNLVATISNKADKTYVDTQLATKASTTYVDNKVSPKADKTYVDTQLATKASTTYVDNKVSPKADKTYVDTQLATKTSKEYVDNKVKEANVNANNAAKIRTEDMQYMGVAFDRKGYNNGAYDTSADVPNLSVGDTFDYTEGYDSRGNISDAITIYSGETIVTSANDAHAILFKFGPGIMQVLAKSGEDGICIYKCEYSYSEIYLYGYGAEYRVYKKPYVLELSSVYEKVDEISSNYVDAPTFIAATNGLDTRKADKTEVESKLATKADKTSIESKLATKVDKVSGKGLSSNDFIDRYQFVTHNLADIIEKKDETQTGVIDITSNFCLGTLWKDESRLNVGAEIPLANHYTFRHKVDKIDGNNQEYIELSCNTYYVDYYTGGSNLKELFIRVPIDEHSYILLHCRQYGDGNGYRWIVKEKIYGTDDVYDTTKIPYLFSPLKYTDDKTEELQSTISTIIQNDEDAQSYGIQFDTSVSSPTCTRIGSPTLHKTLPIQSKMRGCLLQDDGTVYKYLSASDWTTETRDGSRGQVMVEIPEHYRKCTQEGTICTVRLSELPIEGYTKVSKMYVSAYEASIQRSTGKLCSVVNTTTDYRGGNNTSAYDGTYRSLLGIPVTNLSRTAFREAARKRSKGDTRWNLYMYHAHKAIFWLFATEYATLNSQAAYNAELTADGYRQGGLGAGVTNFGLDWNAHNGYNPMIPCGYTDALGNSTGEVTYNVMKSDGTVGYAAKVARYRGIENPFGHIWKWTDGINIEINPTTANGGNNLSKVYVREYGSGLSDTGYSGYRHVGNEARTDGYVKQIIFGNGGEIIPSVVGGSSTTYFCDYHWTYIPSTTTLRGVLFGGTALRGAVAGLVFAYSYNAPSDAGANVGSRLCFLA